MTFASLVFYFFSTLLIGSAVMVISARNTVHSVFFLIFSFFNASALFLLIGAEYIAMTLVIVYVGAVAVLFLFVVMMMDIDYAALKAGFLRYLPLGLLVALGLCAELYFAFDASLEGNFVRAPAAAPVPSTEIFSNTEAIGNILYTQYFYAFQVSGLILLVAMVGAIVLTLRHREGVRRQNVTHQHARRREESVAIVKVQPGQGV